MDLIRAAALHMLIAGLLGAAWAWVLILCQRLERRHGSRVPFVGGVGVLAIGSVLLFGGWQLLLPLQDWLLARLQPVDSTLFVALALLAAMIWIGFALGVAVGIPRRPTVDPAPEPSFGFRRRR